MQPIDHELTASQVLQVFHHSELNLFLGAAFVTVGVITGALCVLRRKFDAVLVWLALFAFLYGNRLWLQSPLLGLIVPDSRFFESLRASASYVVQIPGFFFFGAAGFLSRSGKIAVYYLCVLFACLFVCTFVFGPLRIFDQINNVVVIAALIWLIARSWTGEAVTRDFVVIRWGLLVFAALALCDNITGYFGHRTRIEAVGFVVFLGTLGYVAARQTIQRDLQLGEIQKELEVARRIQLSILPGEFPSSRNFRVSARYVPMTSVAGDFYDFVLADENEVGLLIADVSGHGVPAALIASMVKLAATSQRANAANPAQLLGEMNAALCGNTQTQFVTAAYVYLNSADGELRYSAAAHPPMLLLRDGVVTEVVENGLMLAAFTFADYTTAVQPLVRGDRLLLYTDGIVEAADARQEEFGRERLGALLRESAGMAHGSAADLIMSAVQRWAVSQEDDLTLLVCDYGSA